MPQQFRFPQHGHHLHVENTAPPEDKVSAPTWTPGEWPTVHDNGFHCASGSGFSNGAWPINTLCWNSKIRRTLCGYLAAVERRMTVNRFGYWQHILLFKFSYAEFHLVIAVIWEVVSCMLTDANISTLVMETARSAEILCAKLNDVMSQNPINWY